jgi:hypothetical protein
MGEFLDRAGAACLRDRQFQVPLSLVADDEVVPAGAFFVLLPKSNEVCGATALGGGPFGAAGGGGSASAAIPKPISTSPPGRMPNSPIVHATPTIPPTTIEAITANHNLPQPHDAEDFGAEGFGADSGEVGDDIVMVT